MPPATKGIKKSTSDRNRRRKKTVSSIIKQGFIASEPCFRCIEKDLVCIVLEDGHCSQCVSVAMEGSCDSACDGPIKSVVTLMEKEAELEKELAIIAELSAKATRLSKIIKLLETKLRKEINALHPQSAS